MTRLACPSELELDRAVSVGADPELAVHLDGCEVCRALWDETVGAVELVRELPFEAPSAIHIEERRTALLAAWEGVSSVRSTAPIAPFSHDEAGPDDPANGVSELAQAKDAAPPGSRRDLRWIALTMGVAATVVIAIAARPGSHNPDEVTAPPRRGVVHAHEGARFTLAARPPDEIVRLRDGVIDLDVDPLSAGERFRVVVGTDEVEVRGTSFEVVAMADHLVSVHVVHGRVEVRRAGNAPVVLSGGEAWHAPVASVLTPAPTPAPVIVSPARPTPTRPAVTTAPNPPRVELLPAPAPPPKAPDPQEAAFVRGWDAMRQGEYGQAAAAFNRAVALAPDGALSEDATFWHAVAVARLHRTSEAIAAFRSFLDAFPVSTRAGEASAMLGWLLVETHELDEARRRFHAAENDPNVNARASALQGLEALDGKRP
ncbi:MAG: tetratricopeptide repeat protein [Myxococcales bacterium]|nr:tetratricopeptide repeat protein [Myxococcales bacterium]